MRRMGISAGGVIMAMVVACGNSTEHPPPAEVTGGSSGASGGLVDGGPRGEGGLGDGGGLEGGVIPPLAAMDPKGMLLLGTLVEGLAGREVLTSLADANVFSAGFDSIGPNYGFIHPTDGFVYVDEKAAHKFVPDTNPKLEIDGTRRNWVDYPKDPQANDPILPMLPCTNDVQKVLYAPDTGKYFHTCATSANDLRDDTGTIVATCLSAGFLAVGYNKTILCREVVYDSTGASHPLDPTIPTAVAYRGKPDGTFHLVSVTGSGTGATYALWNVSPTTGTGAKVYDYAKLASFGPINADVRGWIEIDSQARLYRWGSSTTTVTSTDVIARFDDKGGELVYNEANVFVKMHGSNMITGY